MEKPGLDLEGQEVGLDELLSRCGMVQHIEAVMLGKQSPEIMFQLGKLGQKIREGSGLRMRLEVGKGPDGCDRQRMVELASLSMYLVKSADLIEAGLDGGVDPMCVEVDPCQAQMGFVGKQMRIERAIPEPSRELGIGVLEMTGHGNLV